MSNVGVGEDIFVFFERRHESIDGVFADFAVIAASIFGVVRQSELYVFSVFVFDDGELHRREHGVEDVFAIGVDFVEVDFCPKVVAGEREYAFGIGREYAVGTSDDVFDIGFVSFEWLVLGIVADERIV